MDLFVTDLLPQYTKEAAQVEAQCLDTAWTEAQIREILGNKNAFYAVAVSGGTVCGIISGYSVCGDGQIINLAVLPSHRQMGIATKLTEHLFLRFCQAKTEAVTLEVACDNEKALAFYKKIGFVAVGRRNGFYHGTDALVLEKIL